MIATVPAVAVLREREWAFTDGLRAIQQAGEAMLPLAKKIWASPRYAQLVDQRAHLVVSRCTAPGCHDRCSRCVRARAVEINRRRYGQDDFPGRGQS